MKVLFVHSLSENLGIEYLSAMLKKNGHETALLFDPCLFNDPFLRQKRLSEIFSFRKSLVQRAVKAAPGLVAFSVMSDTYAWACRFAGEIKKKLNVPIVFGGIHPTCDPERVIRNDFVDYVVVGEGEYPLAELADHLAGGKQAPAIRNVWWKRDGEIFRNDVRDLVPDLDALPFPDKELFRGAVDLGSQYLTVTSRGCPYSCSFCANIYLKKLYRGKGDFMRRRSVPNVIAELAAAKRKYRPGSVLFYDDSFASDLGWLKAFAGEYKKNVGLPFYCLSHPDMTEEGVELLKSAGCIHAGMGFYTSNAGLARRALYRSFSREQIERTIRLFRRAQVTVGAFTLAGIPGQREEDVAQDIDFFSRNTPDLVYLHWVRYYPRTEIGRPADGGKPEQGTFLTQGGSGCDPGLARITPGLYLPLLLPGALARLLIKKGVRFHPALNIVLKLLAEAKYVLGSLFKRKGIIERQIIRKKIAFYSYHIGKRLFA